jgi:hypothetical protein
VKRTRTWTSALALAAALAGCQPADEPDFSYYEERIAPVVSNGCSRSNTGCHVPEESGIALGNLDLSSYDALLRRDDVLDPYGPYSVGLFLLKAGDPIDVSVQTFDPDQRFVQVTTDIRHNAGNTVDLGSRGYAQLKNWIEAGYPRSGVPDETLAVNTGACRSEPGRFDRLYDPSAEPDPATFQDFVATVEPILERRCAGSSCHGAPIADLYLSCGDDEAQLRWNYWIATQFIADPASVSGLLRRPLSTLRGGTFHEGGNVFGSVEDEDYVTLRDWIERTLEALPNLSEPPAVSEGEAFFVNRVQPAMVREGCMFLNCHSPSMFHDLRLRGGAQGVWAPISALRNYQISRELLALDSPDPNESRLIAKNLFPNTQVAGGQGIVHRGGSLFEDFGFGGDGVPNLADPTDCDAFDVDEGDLNEIPPYCVFARWHELEREEAIAAGEIFPETDVVRAVLYVSRPAGVGEVRDFDTYRPGADLIRAPATVGADGALGLGGGVSVLGGCGLDPSTADVRGPAVSWDGARVAFAARSAAAAPLRLYWMDEDGSNCERIPGIAPDVDEANGILTHDLDPAWAPDGRLVFASTRGNLDPEILPVAGPTRTPAALQPNANLYIRDEDGSLRQMTYLLNQELQPSFMTDGRLIFTAEKRQEGFHQLAGRRQNLDGGDYHPLFAQRDSVGYEVATEITEAFDRNLVFVAAPLGAADGAGTIAVINRSLGPDQDDRDPDDRYYLASSTFPVGAPGAAGAYRSPVPLPSGRILASCDRDAADLTTGGYAFALCEIDVATGNVREVVGSGGRALVEAAAVLSRAEREVFESRIDEANGTTRIEEGATDARVDVLDFPLLATLLFANTREGRPIDPNVGGFDVFGVNPPPTGTTSFAGLANVVTDDLGQFYDERVLLGHVDLNADGSTRLQYTGGRPVLLRVTDWEGQPLTFPEGAPFTGEITQREAMQFYPGERIRQSFPRTLFNPMCGGCHGSLTNRELDVAADVDVLTSASWTVTALADDQGFTDLRD